MTDADLEQRAALLYPGNAAMRAAWISAVEYLRRGRGWIRDQVEAEALREKARAIAKVEATPRFAERVVPIKGKRRRA